MSTTGITYADGWHIDLWAIADGRWGVIIKAASGEIMLERVGGAEPTTEQIREMEIFARLRFAETEFRRGRTRLQ